MKITVIGRGFAGLTAAIVLHEAGHEVALVGPKADKLTASTAAHGACTIKGLHEASQTLFALKLRGHQTFLPWLKKIIAISGADIPVIHGISERFTDLAHFKVEQDRIYKSRFLGAFCVKQIACDASDWSRNFYPQDFWIDTDRYLRALEDCCAKLNIPVLSEQSVTEISETKHHVTLVFSDQKSRDMDAAILAVGAGIGSMQVRSGAHLKKELLGASGYTGRMRTDLVSDGDPNSFCAVKELAALAYHDKHFYLGSSTERNGLELNSAEILPEKSDDEIQHLFSSLYKKVIGVACPHDNGTWRAQWGLRVRTRDRRPVIGAISSLGRIFVNSGYYKSGITLTPLGAAFLAGEIERRPSDPLLETMNANRFTQTKTSL